MKEIVICALCFIGGIMVGNMLQRRVDSELMEELLDKEEVERKRIKYYEKQLQEKRDLIIGLKEQNIKLFNKLKLTNGEGNDKI